METQITVKVICPGATQAWIKKGALLLDIREKEEVAQLAFDVPLLVNIPLSVFEEEYAQLEKQTAIVVVGADPSKCMLATAFLMRQGFGNVMSMKSGIAKWVHKGYPVKGDVSGVTGQYTCCSSEKCN